MTPAQERRQLIKDYGTTFGTPEGLRVLADLHQSFNARTTFVRGDPYASAFREGMREVYLRICDLIEEARHPRVVARVQREVVEEEEEESTHGE